MWKISQLLPELTCWLDHHMLCTSDTLQMKPSRVAEPVVAVWKYAIKNTKACCITPGMGCCSVTTSTVQIFSLSHFKGKLDAGVWKKKNIRMNMFVQLSWYITCCSNELNFMPTVANPSWDCGGLGPNGALHGADHLQVPEGWAWGPLLPPGNKLTPALDGPFHFSAVSTQCEINILDHGPINYKMLQPNNQHANFFLIHSNWKWSEAFWYYMTAILINFTLVGQYVLQYTSEYVCYIITGLCVCALYALFADGASFEHTRKPRVHSRDHVRVLQRTRAVHRCAGQPHMLGSLVWTGNTLDYLHILY